MNARQFTPTETHERRRPCLNGRIGPPEVLDIDPDRVKAVAVFRYRGMEREARLALQLGQVERLIQTIEAIFDGLDSTADQEAATRTGCIDRSFRDRGLIPETADTAGTVSKQIELIETVLERALTQLRQAAAPPPSSPVDGAS